MWFKTIYFLCFPFHKVNLCDLVLGYTYYCILLINHEYISIACCLSCLRILKHYLLATMTYEPEKWGVKYVGEDVDCGAWTIILAVLSVLLAHSKQTAKPGATPKTGFAGTPALSLLSLPPSESVAPNWCG